MGKDGVEKDEKHGGADLGGGLDFESVNRISLALSKERSASEEEEEVVPGNTPEKDISAEFPKFTEKKIRNMIRAPFELAFLLTGVQEVKIKPEEIDLILEDTVDVMNYFVKVNPIYLAVFGILVNGGAITMSKIQAFKAAKARPVESDETRK